MSRGQTLSTELELSRLGPTPQAALRNIADEFERRGWHDETSGALAVVRLLESSGGSASWRSAAGAVPSVFLSSNRVLRRDLVEALKAVSKRG
jgi:hypothetical protein